MPKYVTDMRAEERLQRALKQSHAILFCISSTFEGRGETGSFSPREDYIYDAQYAAMDLVEDAQEAFEELMAELKAEQAEASLKAAA